MSTTVTLPDSENRYAIVNFADKTIEPYEVRCSLFTDTVNVVIADDGNSVLILAKGIVLAVSLVDGEVRRRSIYVGIGKLDDVKQVNVNNETIYYIGVIGYVLVLRTHDMTRSTLAARNTDWRNMLIANTLRRNYSTKPNSILDVTGPYVYIPFTV